MNVVDLRECRSLLQLWSDVRRKMIQGQTTGLLVCVKRPDGSADVVFAGDYETNPNEAVRAAMQRSWDLTQTTRPSKRRRP